MKQWLERYWYLGGLCIAAMVIALIVFLAFPVLAAPMAKDPVPETCIHIATADTIKVYFCEDIDLFVNNLGFMVFEP